MKDDKTTTQAPHDLTRERLAIRELALFCLAHDPVTLAAAVETDGIPSTRLHVAHLRRWLDKYAAALPPGVQ